jgi:hypothetical protein
MRTLRRRREPARETQIAVTVALHGDEAVEPGDMVMLEDLGACLVLVVRDPDRPEDLPSGERAVILDVELFAYGNQAPDVP